MSDQKKKVYCSVPDEPSSKSANIKNTSSSVCEKVPSLKPLNSTESDVRDFMTNNQTEKIQEKSVFVSNSLRSIFSKFLDIHQSFLETQGMYINWDYLSEFIKKSENDIDSIPMSLRFDNIDILKKLSSRTFFDYRLIWAYNKFNKTFSKYISELGLKPYKWVQKSKYLETGHTPIVLEKLVEQLIDKLVEKEELFIKKFDYNDVCNVDFGGNISIKNLFKIYENQKLYRWYGFVYLLYQTKDINGNSINFHLLTNNKIVTNGAFIVGFSTRKWNKRWYLYKKRALLDKYSTLPINKLILDLNKSGINLDDAFNWYILEICWTDEKLRKREDYWINFLESKISHNKGGLNTVVGGGGGIKVFVPRKLLVPYIAKGFRQTEILSQIKNDKSLNFSIDIIYQRINDYWGGLAEAREMFLKPILEHLIKNGYSSVLISEIFHRDRATIRNWCYEFWQKSFEETRELIFKDYLKDLIIRGYEYREIGENINGMPWPTINDYITKWWGGIKSAREIFMKPLLADGLSKGFSKEELAEYLQMSDIDIVRKFIAILWDIPSEGKSHWTYVDKFVQYINQNNLGQDEIMKLDYNFLKRINVL